MVPQFKNFENISFDTYKTGSFTIICVSEIWCSNTKLKSNSNLSLEGFDSVPYKRSKKSRGGGVLTLIKKNLSCKIRK